jgi:hypothetical protein
MVPGASLALIVWLVSTLPSSAQLSHRLPESPLSWQEISDEGKPATFSLSPVLGLPAPTWVKYAMWHDETPFGGKQTEKAWIVRFESAGVQFPDSTLSARIQMTLAISTANSELLCAFTEPAPIWAKANWPSEIKTAEVGSSLSGRVDLSPAEFRNFRSTPMEVLAALWRFMPPADPRTAGQVILRPRHAHFPQQLDVDGNDRTRPSANVWVAEVLGTVVLNRSTHGQERIFTTHIGVLRDGDLEYVLGTMLP